MKENQKSFISVAVLLIVVILVFLASYFLSFNLTESKISQSQIWSAQTYYLAEAGINEAIWKLKNDTSTSDGDEDWKNKFIEEPDCLNFNNSFTRTGTLFSNGSYEVEIKNSKCGQGQIISRAALNLPGGKTSQRVIKVKVFKALNPLPIEDDAVFTGGASENIDINASIMNVHNGNIFSNNNLIIQIGSALNVNDDSSTPGLEGKVLVVKNLNKSSLSTLNATAKCAKNICEGMCDKCPPDPIEMPMIDFDSDDANSYKTRAEAAGTVYTPSQFEDLLWNNQNLTLNNKVTYVTGDINLKGGQNLTVNGVLAADGKIDIGKDSSWCRCVSGEGIGCGQGEHLECRSGNSQLTINHSEGNSSGFLAKSKINVGLFANQINIAGLLYTNGELKITSMPQSFNIVGEIAARKISLISVWQALNITCDNDIIREVIGVPEYSSVVIIEHWEETY